MEVYTDGACSNNPGPGGWAWITEDGNHGSGGEPETTNQRMELSAVLFAIKSLDGPLEIHSDSTYVVNCFKDKWYEGWKKRGWLNSQRKPVANRDLWEPLVDAYRQREDEITFTWVKGHSGNRLNEAADALAVAEVTKLKQMSSEAGPSSEAIASIEPSWPTERAIVITGVRELDAEQAESLAESVAELDPNYDIVISGLRLGAELEAAEQAQQMGVPTGVVLPFSDPVKVWAPKDKARFDKALEQAEWVVTLDGDRSAPAKAVRDRNEWMWLAAVGAIVVGDEELADEAEQAGLGVIGL